MVSVCGEEITVTAPPKQPWQTEVDELLARAAALCAENGVDLGSFVQAASSAYVEARPGMREWLEEMQLRAQLAHARQHGRVAEA